MTEIKWKDIAEKDISGIKAECNGKVAEVILFEGMKNIHSMALGKKQKTL